MKFALALVALLLLLPSSAYPQACTFSGGTDIRTKGNARHAGVYFLRVRANGEEKRLKVALVR